MAEDVKRLLLQIDASVELLKRNLSQGDDHVARFERDTKRRLASIDQAFSGLGRGVTALSSSFNVFRGALAALGVSFGIAQISQFVRQSFELASSLGETAQQLGVTTRALQVYRYIGAQVGITQEEMDRGLQKLNRTLGEAAQGAERPTRVLRALGFTLAEIRRGLDVDSALPRIADGLSRVENSAQRAAVEVMLFGRAGQQLDTLLTQGGARINELAAAAERLGYVLSDDQIARLDDAADRYAALKTLLQARIAAVVADNVDAIMSLVNGLSELVDATADAIRLWRSFRLELEASRLQNQLNTGDTPPEWGLGGTGHALTPQQRAQSERRIAEIRAEQARISEANHPTRERAATPWWVTAQRSATRSARGGGTTPNLDNLQGSGRSAADQRTAQQAFAAFEQALNRRGIRRNRGRSGFRTRQDQADIFAQMGRGNAAPPGTSDHEFWRAMDLPANVDWGAVMEAAREAGINGVDRLVHGSGRNRHTHASWSGHGRPGETTGAGGGEAEAERERERLLREGFQYDSELRRARAASLSAARDISTDYGEQADISRKILDIERQQEFAAIDLQVTLGERSEAQADALKAEYDIADKARRQALAMDLQQRRLEDLERLEAVAAELARDRLEGEGELATTAAARRRIELRILDLAHEEERARLQRIIDLGRGDADEEEARRRLAALPGQHAQRRASINRNTMGPLERFLDGIPDSAEEMNEALQEVAADGLQSLNDGLVDAIMGARSLGDVFKNVARAIIADLLRIAIQTQVIQPLAQRLFGAMGGGGSGLVEGVAKIGQVVLGSKFGGFKAGGGDIQPGKWYIAGERGPEIVVPKMPATVVPNGSVPGGATTHRVVIELPPEFDGRVARVSGPIAVEVVRRAEPALTQAATVGTVAALSRPELA